MEKRLSEVEKSVAVLGSQVGTISSSVNDLCGTIKENTETVNNLIIQFSKSETREDMLSAEVSSVKEKLELFVEDFENEAKPVIERERVKQQRADDFFKGMSTSSGKVALGVIVMMVLLFTSWLFGIDFSNVKVGK